MEFLEVEHLILGIKEVTITTGFNSLLNFDWMYDAKSDYELFLQIWLIAAHNN